MGCALTATECGRAVLAGMWRMVLQPCVFVRVSASPCHPVRLLVSVLECQMLWGCVCLCVCHPVRLWVRWCQCQSVRCSGVVCVCACVTLSPCPSVGALVSVSDVRVLCVFVRVSPCRPVRLWVRWCQCQSVRYPGVVAGCSEVFSPTLDYRGRGNNPLHVLWFIH